MDIRPYKGALLGKVGISFGLWGLPMSPLAPLMGLGVPDFGLGKGRPRVGIGGLKGLLLNHVAMRGQGL